MPFELDADLHPRMAPLAWLVGRWEGAGVWGYPTTESGHYGEEIIVSHDGRPFLRWEARSWLLDEDGSVLRPSAQELGYWRVLPDGEIELLLTHHTGIVEIYAGHREDDRPVLNLRTDGVMRSPDAKEYNAGARMYGLVEGDLMYAMDMAAVGEPMTSHLSARLQRVG